MYDVWSLSVKPSTHHLTNNVSYPPGTGLDGTRHTSSKLGFGSAEKRFQCLSQSLTCVSLVYALSLTGVGSSDWPGDSLSPQCQYWVTD